MNTRLTIKNFRVFDENGASIDIKPITILTGANSSGKSTVVKAVFLLNSFLSQIKNAVENGNPIDLEKYKLDFTKYPNNLLGRFDKIVNENSNSKKITLEYTTHSLMLSEDVTVQLVFSTDDNDELCNGYLESLSMSLMGNVFYSSKKEESSYCNLNVIKDYCCDFLLTEFLVHNFCSSQSTNDLECGISINEPERGLEKMIKYLHQCNVNWKNDIVRYIRTARRKQSIIHNSKLSALAIKETKEKNSFFVTPIIDKLSQIPKSDVKSFVEFIVLKGAEAPLLVASRKVIDSYLASDFKTFGDYFRHEENNYLEHVQCYNYAPYAKQLHLLNAKELKFHMDYIKHLQHVTTGDLKACEQKPLTFDALYEIVIAWNKSYCDDNQTPTIFDDTDAFETYGANPGYVYHHSYKLLSLFVEELLQEVMCPDWSGNMSYVSSSRANVSRLYTLDDANDFSILLQNYFEKKRLFDQRFKERSPIEKRKYRANRFLNRWIKKLEIGESIRVKTDKDGLGVSIQLHKTKNSKGRLLADEGYGITQLVSILLQIETAILSAQGEKVNKFWGLEVLDHYDIYQFHYELNTIAIEEPEIHLHPKYQSLLADMFLEAYEKYNIHFIIETHSEYLIRKAQVFVARRNYKNEEAMNKENPFKVYYVPRGEKPYEMTFNIDGAFQNEFGKGFFDEATNLAFEIL